MSLIQRRAGRAAQTNAIHTTCALNTADSDGAWDMRNRRNIRRKNGNLCCWSILNRLGGRRSTIPERTSFGVNLLVTCLIAWLIDWFDWLVQPSIDRLIDWLVSFDSMTDCFVSVSHKSVYRSLFVLYFFRGRHYYWNVETDEVSWFPPEHPKANVTVSANKLRAILAKSNARPTPEVAKYLYKNVPNITTVSCVLRFNVLWRILLKKK